MDAVEAIGVIEAARKVVDAWDGTATAGRPITAMKAALAVYDAMTPPKMCGPMTWAEVTAGDIVEIDGKSWGVMRVEQFQIEQNSTIPWYVLQAQLRSTTARTDTRNLLRSPHELTSRVGHVRTDAVQRGDEGWADTTRACCDGTGNAGTVLYPIACSCAP